MMGLGFFCMSNKRRRDLSTRIPTCGKCRLNKTCQSPRMPLYGEGERKIMLVGEAPGRKEDERGIPFVGESGQKLRESLEDVGIDMDEDCWRTNAVVCRPPNNRTPTPKEIDGCRPWLFRAIKKFDPNVIILLGSTATSSLIEPVYGDTIGSLERWTGWTIPNWSPNTWIVSTWHPSYLLRTNQKVLDNLFTDHLKKAVKLSTNKPKIRDYASQVKIEVSPSKAAEQIKRIEKAGKPFAFDFETTTLKPETPGARIISCSMSNGYTTVAFPWAREARKAAEALLAGPLPKIAHNAQFEERWSAECGGGPVNNWWWDSMIAAHILDNRSGTAGLKFQSFVQLGQPIYNSEVEPYMKESRNGINKLDQIPINILLKYNGLDALLTCTLAKIQMELIIDF